MRRVALPSGLRAQILREAQAAIPGECCGLLEGDRDGACFRITALHAVRNIAGEADRFAMDAQGQIAAQKTARANGQAIIGCYHSHPHGNAVPSAADLAGAAQEDFLWLIAGGEGLNAFVYLCGEFVGADWVTSSE